LDGVVKIYSKEGIRGFFTRLRISLLRDVPFSLIFFPIYEMNKKFFSFLFRFDFANEDAKNRGFYIAIISALSSIFANFTSYVITHPLIRTRVFF
jgi:hypothetical protein